MEVEVEVEQLNLGSSDPVTLTQFLQVNAPLTDEIIKAFKKKAAEIASQNKKLSMKERRWLADYCINIDKLMETSSSIESSDLNN